MSNFYIITDSGCDLSQDYVDAWGLGYVPLSLNYPEKSHYLYADFRGLGVKEFYQSMRDGAAPTTSATTSEQWVEVATPALEAGQDVLLMAFSSGISATYQSSVIAMQELKERFPERKIYAPDNLCVSLGLGLLVKDVVKLRDNGGSIEDAVAFIENNKQRLAHWFTVETLTYLHRGGRVSTATAIAGNVLGIKPILHVDDEGRLVSMSKKRGRKASLQALADKVVETIENPEEQDIFISHGDCIDDVKTLEAMLRERINFKECYANYVGPVIGAHSGPGTMAVFFYAKER